MNPKITRIRVKSDGAKITYSLGNALIALSGTSPVSENFAAALANLSNDIVKLLGLPAKYADGLIVTGATFFDKGEGEAVVIVAKKTLREGGSPFNILTPIRFMSEPVTDEEATEGEKAASSTICVDDLLREKLTTLRDEAALYVTSCPEQRQLYLALEGSPDVLKAK